MSQEGNNQFVEVDRVEDLRNILERQQSKMVTREEALEIGESLITFFELLGEDPITLSVQPYAEGIG
jgi:hypothetical protein